MACESFQGPLVLPFVFFSQVADIWRGGRDRLPRRLNDFVTAVCIIYLNLNL